MRSKQYAEYDGYDMRKKSEMTSEEARKLDIEARKARAWIAENMGISFPSASEAIRTGKCIGKKNKKAEIA